jgi:hypothetical protein
MKQLKKIFKINFRKILDYFKVGFGLIVTILLLLAFVPKFVGEIEVQGVSFLSEIPKAFINWYDDPTAFFISYFIGYIIIWWNPLLGSIIIVIGDILFFAFNNQNMGTFIFIIPTFIVASLYFISWINQNNIKQTF